MESASAILAATGTPGAEAVDAIADLVAKSLISASVEGAIAFYKKNFGFQIDAQSGPYFALLSRDGMQLVLSPPMGPGGGSQPMPDGRRPEPGGWNRIIVRTRDLDREADGLRKAGVLFRNEIVAGPGGRQILIEDPSGNLVELFEPPPDSDE